MKYEVGIEAEELETTVIEGDEEVKWTGCVSSCLETMFFLVLTSLKVFNGDCDTLQLLPSPKFSVPDLLLHLLHPLIA